MKIHPPSLSRRPHLGVLVAGCLLVAACGASGNHAPGAPHASPTPVCHRGPAMVQVENAPEARPLYGIQQADIVYEYLTEGGITRLTAIYFHPSGSQKIEPVRSARLATLRLQKAYQGLIFYSGASNHVQGIMWSQHIPEIRDDGQHTQYFRRDPGRAAPHNLYTEGDWLAQGQSRQAPCMSYRVPAAGTPPATGATAGNRVAFDQTPSHHSTFTYQPQAGTYTYAVADTGTMVDADLHQPLQIKNVVLIQVAHHNAGYIEDVAGAPGIDYSLTGTGPADVFTGGHRYAATWDLSDPTHPLRILAKDGTDFGMPSGLTWIALIDPGTPLAVG